MYDDHGDEQFGHDMRHKPPRADLLTSRGQESCIGRFAYAQMNRSQEINFSEYATLLFCLVQGATHLIPLDPANYFVSWVPVKVNLPWILPADAAAFAGILLLVWLASRKVVSGK